MDNMGFNTSSISDVSNRYSEDDTLTELPCFSCKGTHVEPYLQSGYFDKFLEFELIICKPKIDVFGRTCLTNSCFRTMHKLFCEIKEHFSVIKSLAINSIDIGVSKSFIEKCRLDIVKLLQLFLTNLQIIYSKQNFTSHITSCVSHLKNLMTQMLKEIKHLLLFVGPFSSVYGLTSVNFEDDFCKSSDYYNYYHLCLDIWFLSIAVCYVIQIINPVSFVTCEVFCSDFSDQSNPFVQLSSFVICEFIFIAANQGNNSNIGVCSPFLCSCIKDFWIMLINLFERVNSPGLSFWNIYLTGLQIVLNASTNLSNKEPVLETLSLPDSRQVQNSEELCLWLTSHIATLYKYDTRGKFCDYRHAKNGYAVAKYCVQKLLSSPQIGEKMLRKALFYCLELIKLWEPSGDVLFLLTDFYIKKIDDNFSLVNIELKGFSQLYKDAYSWYIYYTSLKNSSSCGDQNSFNLFLVILNFLLKHDHDGSLWRSLKGRIYSRLMPKKIKEMSESGLQNIFSLFFMIASAEQFDIISKACEVASLIETTNPKKQMISWKALFVLLYVCEEKKEFLGKIATTLSKFFNSACTTYAMIKRDSLLKTDVMNLLLVYIDNLNELYEKSVHLHLSEFQLIGAEFPELFSACSISELNYILGVFLNILQKVQKSLETCDLGFDIEVQHIGILQSTFSYVYPFIENVATAEAPPPLLADVASALTILTYQFSSDLAVCMPVEFHRIFTYFCNKDTVNTAVTCRYLCFVLDYPNLVAGLKEKVLDLNLMIVQSWIKCTIFTQTSNNQIQELAKKILHQHECLNLFPDLKLFDFKVDHHVQLLINFYRLVGDFFSKCSSVQKKKEVASKVQQYHKNFTALVLVKAKKEKDRSSFHHLYKLISHLIEFCAPVLHFSVSSECSLLNLIDRTLYPQLMFPKDKTMQSLVSFSVKEYLPSIMRGLFKLDFKRDKSVEREIRDLFIYYLGVFPASANPLTKLVYEIPQRKPDSLPFEAFDFILETLKWNLISNNIEKPLSIFEFYQEVFRQVPPACKKEITTVLLKCTLEIYMNQNDSLTDFLKTLIRKLFVYYRDSMPLNITKLILIPIIQWFIQEKLQWAVTRGFSFLDIMIEYLPHVVSEVIPFLTKSVETFEKNRGLGEDLLLRNGLRNLVSKLQKKFT